MQRFRRVGDLDAILSQMTAALDQLNRGMQGSAGGLHEIGSGADDMRAGIDGIRDNVDAVSGYLTPLRNFVDTTPDCPANAICSLVSRVVQLVDSVIHSSSELSSRSCPVDGRTCGGRQTDRRADRRLQLTGRHAELGRPGRRDLALPCECAGSGTARPTAA